MEQSIKIESEIILKMIDTVKSIEYDVDLENEKIIFYGSYLDSNSTEVIFEKELSVDLNFDKKQFVLKSFSLEDLTYNIIFNRGALVSYVLNFELEDIEIEDIKTEVLDNIDEILTDNLKDRKDNFFVESIQPNQNKKCSKVEEDHFLENEGNKKISDSENDNLKDKNPDRIAENKINYKPDQVVCSEQIMNTLSEAYSKYKIIFNAEEEKLESLANKYGKDIHEIYKDNNYQIDKRIIIRDVKES